jgi:hypothetical protein
MAYNIIAESSKTLDYKKLHAEIFTEDLFFEIIPMPKLGIRNGDAIGICVPLKYANETTWEQLKPVLNKLRTRFCCDVYDLYGGQKLSFFNINTFKNNFLAK